MHLDTVLALQLVTAHGVVEVSHFWPPLVLMDRTGCANHRPLCRIDPLPVYLMAGADLGMAVG